MKITARRFIVSNILVLLIICFVYLLSFNGDVEAAITGVYSKAEYKGRVNVENSVGVMTFISKDISQVYEIEKILSESKSKISYMLSPNLIVENEKMVKKMMCDGVEIGIYGQGEENLFLALGILKSENKNDILYASKNQKIGEDIFSNRLTVVVYSIDANIAFEKFDNEFGDYIEAGTFLFFEHTSKNLSIAIIDAIIDQGFKIRTIGEML